MIPTESAHLTVAATSHPGIRGKNNEDRYGVSAYQTTHSKRIPSVLAVVADGIGGHLAGEVAAEMAVDVITQIVAESDADQPVEVLRSAFIHAGEAIRVAAQKNPAYYSMGTTCSAAWVIGEHLYIATVGDSRIYLLRGSRIQQLSTDHTWVQEAVNKGVLNREQAQGHLNAHVIRRFLGSRKQVVPDLRLRWQSNGGDTIAESNQGASLNPGDILLLCTDGLTDLVADTEILRILDANPLQTALDTLIQLANQRGGHDNITAVALKVPQLQSATVSVIPKNWKRRALVSCLAFVSLLLIGLVLSGGFFRILRPVVDQSLRTPPSSRLQPVLFPTALPQIENVIPTAGPSLILTSTVDHFTDPSTVGITGRDKATYPTLTPWPTNTLSASP